MFLLLNIPNKKKVLKGLTVSNGSSQPGALLLTRGHSGSSEDISDCHSGGRVSADIWQVEAKDAVNAQHCKGPPHRAESRRPRLQVPVKPTLNCKHRE